MTSGFKKISGKEAAAIEEQMRRVGSQSNAKRETMAEHIEAACPPGTIVSVGASGIPHIDFPIRFVVSDSLTCPRNT